MQRQQTIFVGMSGGVDSSVAAALLVRAGHRVVGVFMKNWSDDSSVPRCSGTGGTWQEERADALRVAAHLGIPFETYDFEAEYRERVVAYMVAEYKAGRTPNPDVMCNSKVKFDLFLKRAIAEGADMIATGHYARVTHGANGEPHALLAGTDDNKDQSYFLHRLSQEQLARTLFPVGHLPKPEVRKLAAEFGLPNAEKKDSQGICFVGKVHLRDFLGTDVSGTPGPILTVSGEKVGEHRGIVPYTIGQRQGIGIGGGAPYFVVDKDMARNALIVAHADDEAALHAPALIARDMHWIAGAAPEELTNGGLRCRARIRYRQPLQECTVTAGAEPGTVRIDFAVPQRAVSPGQFAVLYDGDRCLGGADIERAVRD